MERKGQEKEGEKGIREEGTEHFFWDRRPPDECPFLASAEVCRVLGVSPHVLRWRFMKGRYTEVVQDGLGRRFSLTDIKRLVEKIRQLDGGRVTKGVRKAKKTKGSLIDCNTCKNDIALPG